MGDEAVVTTGGTLSGILRFVVVVEPYATLLNTAAMLFSRFAPSSARRQWNKRGGLESISGRVGVGMENERASLDRVVLVVVIIDLPKFESKLAKLSSMPATKPPKNTMNRSTRRPVLVMLCTPLLLRLRRKDFVVNRLL